MFLAAQYYRAPFPERRFWADDLSRARDAGLHGIQLWCLWGWIESRPGSFAYDDYDELIRLADERGLQVVLSTVAEIQPFWIHRVVPGAELLDNTYRAVTSCTRNEVNVGLSPGGCFDHPQIAERMAAFLEDIGARYASTGNVFGWDCWNETRWNVHANALTCFCEHTLADFRAWLGARYGDLDGLNAAWKRRYADWADVAPRKQTGGPFCCSIDFARYQSDRATRHARWRYDALRRAGVRKPITCHGPMPTVVCPPVAAETPMCRGNDWELADVLDGVGSSHFPIAQRMSEEYIRMRMNQVRCSGQGKQTWVSEIQGSTSSAGYVREGIRKSPAPQQRWIHDALSQGYHAMIFWAWRDEVFCREAGWGGMAGWDGLAEERLAAMARTREFLDARRDLLAGARMDRPRVGLLWCPDYTYLDWARNGEIWDAMHGVLGYAMALERAGIEYVFVEGWHAQEAADLDVLLMPWAHILPDPARQAALDLLARGGRVLVEADTDAYDAAGFFRYPDERPFMDALGVGETSRHPLPAGGAIRARLGDAEVAIPLAHFATPLTEAPDAEVFARDDDGAPLLLRRPVGPGAAYVLGGLAGARYFNEPAPGLEALVEAVCRDAGVTPPLSMDVGRPGQGRVFYRLGRCGQDRLLWVSNADDDAARTVTFTDHAGIWDGAAAVEDVFAGRSIAIQRGTPGSRCTVELEAGGRAILRW